MKIKNKHTIFIILLLVFNSSVYYFTEEFNGLSYCIIKTFKHILGVSLLSVIWYYLGNKARLSFSIKKYINVFLIFWLITIIVHAVVSIILINHKI